MISLTRLIADRQHSTHAARAKAAPIDGAGSSSINPLRRLLHRVGGRGAGLRLQRVEITRSSLLRVAGGGEDHALVVLQDLQP